MPNYPKNLSEEFIVPKHSKIPKRIDAGRISIDDESSVFNRDTMLFSIKQFIGIKTDWLTYSLAHTFGKLMNINQTSSPWFGFGFIKSSVDGPYWRPLLVWQGPGVRFRPEITDAFEKSIKSLVLTTKQFGMEFLQTWILLSSIKKGSLIL